MFWKNENLFFLLCVSFFLCGGEVILNLFELNVINNLKFICIICRYPAPNPPFNGIQIEVQGQMLPFHEKISGFILVSLCQPNTNRISREEGTLHEKMLSSDAPVGMSVGTLSWLTLDVGGSAHCEFWHSWQVVLCFVKKTKLSKSWAASPSALVCLFVFLLSLPQFLPPGFCLKPLFWLLSVMACDLGVAKWNNSLRCFRSWYLSLGQKAS